MSDRRVPRYDTYAADYSAELPIWPPRGAGAAPLGPSGHSPRMRGEITGAATADDRLPTADCRLPTAANSVSSQGADRARPAAPSRGSASGGAAFSFDDISDAAAFTPPARREEAGAMPPHAPASALSDVMIPTADCRLPTAALSGPVQMLVGLIGAWHRESDVAAIERAVAHYAEEIGIHVLARGMAEEPPAALRPTPPSVLPDISPARGEIGSSGAGASADRLPTPDCRLPFSKGRAPP